VDYVPFEEKVEVGEWFYTSGDDRIFPRGFPVGVVRSVRDAQPFKEILLEPVGLQHGLEGLIITQGVLRTFRRRPPPTKAPVPAPALPANAGAKPPAGAASKPTDSTRHSNQANGEPIGSTKP
jgi:rod shape-determining protein MreC